MRFPFRITPLLALPLALCAAASIAEAHTSGISYRFESDGSVTFYAANYHAISSPVGGLNIDGTTYNFTSVIYAHLLPADVNYNFTCPGLWVPIIRYQVVNVKGLALGPHTVVPTSLGDNDSGWPNCFPHTFELIQPVKNVRIDLKPGGNPNCVNSGSVGVVSVAVFGTTEMPVSSIDPASITFAGAPVLRWSYEDVTSEGPEPLQFSPPDGLPDLVLKFDTTKLTGPATGENCAEVELTGKLLDGTAIRGKDMMCRPAETNCAQSIPTMPPQI